MSVTRTSDSAEAPNELGTFLRPVCDDFQSRSERFVVIG